MTDSRVLVFDLGGVLLHLNSPREAFDLEMDEGEFLRHWIHSKSVREFERGAVDAESFARSIVDEVSLNYDWREFLTKFNSWPDKLYPGITELLDEARASHRCVLLSNTNALHWNQTGVGDLLTPRFESVFLSYITGKLKPDADVYDMVRRKLNCDPDQIVFFDDNPVNVEAARECSWQSALVKGVDELRESLQRMGAISST
jgi:HAD superfamily hydrolase (TIGR01509 family)